MACLMRFNAQPHPPAPPLGFIELAHSLLVAVLQPLDEHETIQPVYEWEAEPLSWRLQVRHGHVSYFISLGGKTGTNLEAAG